MITFAPRHQHDLLTRGVHNQGITDVRDLPIAKSLHHNALRLGWRGITNPYNIPAPDLGALRRGLRIEVRESAPRGTVRTANHEPGWVQIKMSDATPQSLPQAELNANARTVLDKRYLIKDKSGKPTERPKTCSGA